MSSSSLVGEEVEPQIMSDPLLKAGSFIDPNPNSNSNSNSNSNGDSKPPPETPQKGGSGPPPPPPGGDNSPSVRPDWLPASWTFVERVRSSGASAGTRDKYFLDPVTNRRFRSKKEVIAYLETGTVAPKKKKNGSDADGTTQSSATPNKRKKPEPEPRDITKYFNFDDVPKKVKWELIDVYEGTWRPLNNGVDRVPESAKQDWAAAFTYLALQNGGR